MNSSPWCPARNLSLRLIYCNRGTALRRSARLPLLGWVSTALLPPPFFSSSRRHRLLLAFYCLLSRFIPYIITGTSLALIGADLPSSAIISNPEWYNDVTPTSSFEEFQCELATNANAPDCTDIPCGIDCAGTNWTCSTAQAGDPCFGHVDWAMNEMFLCVVLCFLVCLREFELFSL